MYTFDPAIRIRFELCDSSIRLSADLSATLAFPFEVLKKKSRGSLGLHLPSMSTVSRVRSEGSTSRCQHITSRKQIYTGFSFSPPLFSCLASPVSPIVVSISLNSSGTSSSIPSTFLLSSIYTDTAKSRADLPR